MTSILKDPKPLVFYDASCPLCQRAVLYILKRDQKKIFRFAPLQGKTYKQLFDQPPNIDSMVLVQDGQVITSGKAVLRLYWLLGGKYRFLGWLSFLPGRFFDGLYRLVARHRHYFFAKKSSIKLEEFTDQHLP